MTTENIGRAFRAASEAARRAFVTFNNQNSILLTLKIPERQLDYLLHDNRIFAFKNIHANSENQNTEEQNLLLSMLTTPKYRAMNAMYILFHMLDNLLLLATIVLCFIYHQLITPTEYQMYLLSAIGLELFYDVLFEVNFNLNFS